MAAEIRAGGLAIEKSARRWRADVVRRAEHFPAEARLEEPFQFWQLLARQLLDKDAEGGGDHADGLHNPTRPAHPRRHVQVSPEWWRLLPIIFRVPTRLDTANFKACCVLTRAKGAELRLRQIPVKMVPRCVHYTPRGGWRSARRAGRGCAAGDGQSAPDQDADHVGGFPQLGLCQRGDLVKERSLKPDTSPHGSGGVSAGLGLLRAAGTGCRFPWVQ